MRAPKPIRFSCHQCDKEFQDGEEVFTDYMVILNVDDKYAKNLCKNCIKELRKIDR
jgi:hypothetical protein